MPGERHHRRSIRLPEYDYSQAGAYFVTVVTNQRQNLFGVVQDDRVNLSPIGRMVEQQWFRLATRFPFLTLDETIIMPNHIHGILVITGRGAGMKSSSDHGPVPPRARSTTSRGAGEDGSANVLEIHPRAPTAVDSARIEGYGKPVPGSIPTIIRSFKAVTTLRWHAMRDGKDGFLWQRNYYEHVIRAESDLQRARLYIQSNPLNWMRDGENPG